MFPYQNPSDKEEAWWVQRSRTPEIFRLMTWTMILAQQSVGNGREEALALSLKMEDD